MFVSLARKQRLSRLSSCSPESKQALRPTVPYAGRRMTAVHSAARRVSALPSRPVSAPRQGAATGTPSVEHRPASTISETQSGTVRHTPHDSRLGSDCFMDSFHSSLLVLPSAPQRAPSVRAASSTRVCRPSRFIQSRPISPNLAQSDLLSSTYGHPRLAPHPHLSAGEVVLLVVLCAGAGAYILHLVAAHWATARAEARWPALSHTALSASASLSRRL